MDTTNIQVGIRIRPLIRREIQTNQTCYWNADNKRIYSTEKEYHFDEVFDSTSSTMNIYNILGKPLVENAMRGINGTLFAYGQTASGKTHTILGDVNELGILPLAIKEVFDHTVKQPDREFLLRASFIEIYNEEVTDLLASKKENIKILTNSENDVVVENLTTHTVISYESTMDLVQKGIINRKIGITNMNERSSRSHLIFRLVIESREILELNNSMEANGTIIAAELNVVDLAGSERAGQTGAQGIRLKESSFINTSLMSLGVVIRKLSEGDKSCHIPYRDSKLTRLLQKSLGGNARTCIICTVSPVVLEETQQTLLFASQAKEVKNRPTVNEVLDDKSMMRKQMNEINLLKRKIIELETGISHSEKDKILAEQISYQQKIEKQRERISLLLKEIVCTGRRSFQNVTKKDNMRRLTWCPGGLLKSGKNFNDIKSFDEDIEMDTLDGSFEKIEYQLLKQEFDEYKAQTCSPDEYIKLKDKLTALEIQHETTKNKLRDLIINQEPHEAVQTLREENSRLCNKNEVLSNDNAKLQAEIDISKAKINSLIDDVAMLQEQQESMVDKDYLERLKEVVNAKSLELEESRKKCELENEELIHALANQKKLWNEQVISLEEQKFNLEQELHAANKKIIHECKKSEDFQKELQLLKEQFSILKEENSKAKSQTEMFVDECNDLKLKSDLLISADEDIITKNLLDELELLKQHLSSLNEEKDIAVSEKEMLAKENNDLKLKFSQISCEEDIVKKNLSDELELLKQHLSSLNEEKDIAVSENEMLAKENNDLKLKFSQISCEEDIVKKNLSDELELLKQHLSSLNEEKDIAVSENEMLAKENNGLKLKFSQISCEEDIVKKNLSDELELLKQHLSSLNEEKDIAVSEKEMLAKENNDLKLKFSQISCEEDIVKKNLSDELELLKQHLNSLNEEKDIAVSENEMLAKENNNLKLKFSQISCEEDIVKKNLSDELEQLKQHLSLLNEEKNTAVSENKALAKENNHLKFTQISSVEEDIVKKNLLDELELLKQHLSSLNKEKHIAVSEKEMLAKENNDLKLKFSQISFEEDIVKKNLTDELELLKQHLNSLKQEKDIAVSEKEMLAKENNDLKLKFSQISCEEDIVKKNLSDELELLKQHLNSLKEEKDIAVSEKEMFAKENNDLKLKFSQINCEEDIVKKNLSDELHFLKQHLNLLNEEKNTDSEKEMLIKENNNLKFGQISSVEEDILKKNLLDELELLKQQLNSLNEEKNAAVSEKEMLAEENNHLRLAQISSVEEDIVKKNLSDELCYLKQQLNSLNEQNNIAVSEKEMLAKANNDLRLAQFSSDQEDIVKKNLSDEMQRLKQHLNSIYEEKNNAENLNELLRQENDELKLKVKQYSCSINEFEMKIFDLTQSCDKNIFEQQKKINELIDINKELSIKSNQLSDEKNQISEELDLMTNKFSDIEHNFLVTQTKNHDLMEALKKEQENCAKQCKLSKSAYERKCDQIEAETQVLMNTLKALKAENIQIMEINKVLKSEILVAKENLECQQNEQITIIDKHEKHIKELQNDIALLNKKLETHDEVISKNNDLVQKVTSLEETKIELEQSLNKVNKALKESQLNSTEQSSQLTSVVHKENQPFNNSVNSLKYENLSKEELIDKINHVEHLLELKKKDISVYNDHRIEQNATIEQLKKKNEDLLSRLKRLEQILTDLRKPSGNASTREWEEHCISLERIKVRLESQVLHLEERKRVLKLQLERYQQENTHLNVLIKQKDEKFAKASKENEEEKEKLANAIQNLKIDNERVCTGLKDAFNRMNAAEKALTETKSVAELEISKRDSEIERVSNYLIRSYERYQHYKGIAKNCLENKCSAKIKPIQNDVFTMTESYFPVLSEKSTEQLSSQKRRSNEQLEGERQKSRKKLSNSIKECENEAECNQQ
nr:kinesin-like protein KIN-7I isoform X15 [Hydra vulgaris]